MRGLVVTDAHPIDHYNECADLRASNMLSRVFYDVRHRFGRGFSPDMVLDLGDRSNIYDEAEAISDNIVCAQIIKMYAPEALRLYLPGNHDDIAFKDHQDERRQRQGHLLGSSVETQSFQFPEDQLTVIGWTATVLGEERDGPIIATDEDLDDLRRELEQAQGDLVLLASHIPLDYCQRTVDAAEWCRLFYTNHEDVSAVLAESGKDVVSFSGHLHHLRPNLHEDRRALTFPSLTMGVEKPFLHLSEDWRQAGCYGVFQVDADSFGVVVLRIGQEEPVYKKSFSRLCFDASWAS